MKPKLILWILFFLISSSAFTQQNETVNLDQLKTPTAPAFSLLGVEPTSVERPVTPEGLGVSILPLIGKNGINPNFALEFSPYWLKSRPKLTFDDYYNDKNIGKNILKSLSFSFATSQTEFTDTSKGTGLGFGLRFQLFSGRKNMKVDTALRQLNIVYNYPATIIEFLVYRMDLLKGKEEDGKISFSIDTVLATLEDATKKLMNRRSEFFKELDPSDSKDMILEEQESLEEALMDATSYQNAIDIIDNYFEGHKVKGVRSEIVTQIQKLDQERTGFVWDVAGAGVLNFPTNRYDLSYLTNLGAWTTLGYKSIDNSSFDILGTFRYIWFNNVLVDTNRFFTHNFDIGISLSYHKKRFSLSAEYIHRFSHKTVTQFHGNDPYQNKVKMDSYRMDINFQYSITDDIDISLTLGRNFNQEQVPGPQLLCILGVNYGFSKVKTINLRTKS